MVRKKIDNRLRILIDNGVQSGHRSIFVVVGDKGRDQVPILHHMLAKTAVKARPNVLWCFKKELGFSSHRQKKMKQLQKKIKHGKFDVKEDDPFELFIAATNIRYCYYKDTHKILGNTYGMCILQDFEALTPNLLARTIETVEGGGLVVLLLKSVSSLRQLFTLSMDVHLRYRTEAHQDVVARFNERFILSLATNKNCLVIDDQLDILPISSHIKNITALPPKDSLTAKSPLEMELQAVQEKFQDSQPTGVLLNQCKTLDQAQALLEFIDAITDKKLDRTISLTAARGRGKSAALGLAIAAAVGFGYSNIFVTSPSPENLHTLFDFVFKGFDAMEYEEHTDYDLVQSTNPDFQNAVVRVNVHEKNNHRQTIQYLHPTDAHKLGQAELVVIDEAAAIPLPLVKEILGPYLVFMSSTINGYEGTGRSLSLKLLDQLRQQSNPLAIKAQNSSSVVNYRSLREVALNESIRYKPGDPVEEWLNRLLCLDSNNVQPLTSGCPLPQDCDLYYINRDTLFSFHKASEAFLQRIMSLFVASHYKNSPNDLQMMSDAPAHHLFCLLGPTENKSSLPEVLCVIQVCLEGEISKESIQAGLSRGKRAAGDLIPWTMEQQYRDGDSSSNSFGSLSGARIVRIATHPDYQKMGYGSRAMEMLQKYYKLKIMSLEENELVSEKIKTVEPEDVSLLNEAVGPRDDLPPLLLRLNERKPEPLDYIGVSFGLTQNLLRFWKRCGFTPTYLRQTANDLTGEHSMIMLKSLNTDQKQLSPWLPAFWTDFRKRIVNLLGFDFRKFSPALALSILSNKNQTNVNEPLEASAISHIISPYDMKRLELYNNNMADYHLITDLMPGIARLYFLNQLGESRVSAMQEAILVGIGLQCKIVDQLAKELDLPASQLLGLFNRMIRKLFAALKVIQETDIAQTMGMGRLKEVADKNGDLQPLEETMDEELTAAAKDLKHKQKETLDTLKDQNLAQFQIKGNSVEWNKALGSAKKGSKLGLLSVKSGEKRLADDDGETTVTNGKKAKKGGESGKNKKMKKNKRSKV
ncbi:hypothetical protein TCAL_06345 [Tigriopus californicus]|uniref:RNA cytidine acetyltransferase n=1 Tax=Tigriopus californicus TaxID=6832 RepID=A0A553PCG6_TIGCA|nr:RNA cytidine acetyltransferase-like [Tigriopus californicus]TRY75386.1 hypothetical protein TCAL_06345 [Tigriopus californicus]|eukprot:TCALIF_06345-PA protein Name:"Similar to Nat10 N-acetyltransferase 10 (Mus musculus)" AED:0.00 eAED:0.00 QI:0/-1/0/1/-1/1/1/0/1036